MVSKFDIFTVITMLLILILMYASCFMLQLVLRKAGCKDSVLVALPVLLLSAACARFIDYSLVLFASDERGIVFDTCTDVFVTQMALFPQVAATFVNLAMWANFLIGARCLYRSQSKRYYLHRRRLVITLIALVLCLDLAPLIVIIRYACYISEWWPGTFMFTGLVFLCCGVLLQLVGIMLLRTLRVHFVGFYIQMRR